MIPIRCGRIRLKNDMEGFCLPSSCESAVSEISGRPGVPSHSAGWDLEIVRGSKGQVKESATWTLFPLLICIWTLIIMAFGDLKAYFGHR